MTEGRRALAFSLVAAVVIGGWALLGLPGLAAFVLGHSSAIACAVVALRLLGERRRP